MITEYWSAYSNADEDLAQHESGPILLESRANARELVRELNEALGEKEFKVVKVNIIVTARNHVGTWLPV